MRIHSFGGPEVLELETVPAPEPGPGEVLLRSGGAGVNPVDWKTRTRGGKDLPFVLGWDVAGTVEALGEGVGGVGVGDRLFGLVRFPDEGGAYAEYVAAPADELAPVPAGLELTEAAAVPLAALTAWQALVERAGLGAGQTVLVHAAAGGVGHLAVQIAKARGATVIGTASAANAGFLRSLGVDQVIDYRSQRFEQVVAGVDVVLDTVAGETLERSYGVVREGGWVVTILGHPSGDEAADRGVRVERVLVRPHGEQLRELAELIERGELRPTVQEVLPLAEVRRAHEIGGEGHVRGKLVLDPSA